MIWTNHSYFRNDAAGAAPRSDRGTSRSARPLQVADCCCPPQSAGTLPRVPHHGDSEEDEETAPQGPRLASDGLEEPTELELPSRLPSDASVEPKPMPEPVIASAPTSDLPAELRRSPERTIESASITSHDAVLRERETQVGTALMVVGLLSLIGLAAIALSRPRPLTYYVLLVTLGAFALASFVESSRLRRGLTTIKAGSIVALGIIGTLVALALIAHIGAISMATMTLPPLVYFAGSDDDRPRAWRYFLLSTIGYLMVAAAGMLGWIPAMKENIAFVYADNHRAMPVMAACGVFILAFTFYLATRNRRNTLSAMEQLEGARRQIRQREALLQEARADLNRALLAGRVGRLTGHRVGPYTAEEIIGRGGMGEVYRATDDAGSPVAIKVLHAELQDDKAHVERFFREARVSSDLESPHIVTVLGSGRAEDGSAYLAMELLSGYDLAELLREQPRLRLRDAGALVHQVAEGLSIAQEAGIVHRDLKPQNLFRSAGEAGAVWKILDFGISKVIGASATLTQGAAIGTPSYMSPEQARGEAVDHRSDVFSLGVIAYRVITGRPPFHAPDAVGAIYSVAYRMPEQPGSFVRLHEDVELTLALALAKDRKDRFRSATSFAAALRDASRGELDTRLRKSAVELLALADWGSELRPERVRSRASRS
jgi:serine/threonine protein kinase